MNSQLLIKEALMVLPQGEMLVGDLLVREGKIAAIGTDLVSDCGRIIDARGLVLLPGVIDPQVHFREPGLEHKEDLFTATCACAKGGVTSFLEMPNTIPPTTTQEALNEKLELARQKCLVNYGFFLGATPENSEDLRTANPVCGIKVFMGSGHGSLLVSKEEDLERIFATNNRLIAVHAENQERILQRRKLFAGNTNPAVHSQIQDEETALIATKLAVKLSHKYQRRLHILHLSTGVEAEYLRLHKTPLITTEVTPQHLFLNTTAYEKLGTLAQMNPPLRSPENNEMLWRALKDGVIDCIATDHAPHTLQEKAKPYPESPSGMPGVETSLPLMLTQAKQGRCSLAEVVKWMCTNPAKIYKIPNKGELKVGYDADLVLVDWENWRPVLRENLATKCGWSPFEGWNLTGWPVYTIVNGEVVLDNGRINTQVRGKPLFFSP